MPSGQEVRVRLVQIREFLHLLSVRAEQNVLGLKRVEQNFFCFLDELASSPPEGSYVPEMFTNSPVGEFTLISTRNVFSIQPQRQKQAFFHENTAFLHILSVERISIELFADSIRLVSGISLWQVGRDKNCIESQ